MSTRMPCRGRLLGVVAATFVLLVSQASAQQQFLAKGGQAEAVIVVGHEGDNFDHWVAGELQRYVEQLSGAELSIVSSDRIPPQKLLIVVGSPESNPLVASAEEKELVSFAGLKPGGLVLKTVDLEGRPAVLVGAGDETGTMYAAYELLERLGIVFQLSNDIIPQQKPDLPLPSLDVRMEPAFKERGMFCWHQIRWYMGLKELRQEIDQLAKLKMNVFQFYWGIGGPWAEFSYDGKKAEIFGIKESGFVAWASDVVTWGRSSGTADSVIVGRECFRRIHGSAGVCQRANAGGGLPHRPRIPSRSDPLRPLAQGPGLAGDG